MNARFVQLCLPLRRSPSMRPFSSSPYKTAISLEALAASNETLKSSLFLFQSNDIKQALDLAFQEYTRELEQTSADSTLSLSRSENDASRPAYSFLTELMGSLGPQHPDTVDTLARLESLTGPASHFKVRVIQKQHGGYPVRLNNGKWTWQGPHWSRHNNRTWKTGYSSDFTYGWGK